MEQSFNTITECFIDINNFIIKSVDEKADDLFQITLFINDDSEEKMKRIKRLIEKINSENYEINVIPITDRRLFIKRKNKQRTILTNLKRPMVKKYLNKIISMNVKVDDIHRFISLLV